MAGAVKSCPPAFTSVLKKLTFVPFNESFALTNEREGSEIARQVVQALLERQIKACFVTHLYDFAHTLFEQQRQDVFFLRAERLPDGVRTFKLIEGGSLGTSFGEDLYREVFAAKPPSIGNSDDLTDAV